MSGNILELEQLRDSRELSASQLHLLLHPTQEEEDERLRRSDQLMCLNIGGKRHWVMSRNFVNFPGTRLGRLARATGRDEILSLCDKYWPGETPEFFFDVSWIGFNSILDVYRRGSLHLGNNVCALVTKKDLEYWGIDELLLEPCCALKYYPEIELCFKEIQGEEQSRLKHQERKAAEDFGATRWGKIRKFMWNLTEYPETSMAAEAAAFLSLGVIVISTFCFILSTFPDLQDPEEEEQLEEEEDEEEAKPLFPFWKSGPTVPTIDFESVRFTLRVIDLVTIVYFTVEYIIRFTCSPKKLKFFLQPMNLVDFLAILPYVISFFVQHLQDLHILGKAGKIMRLARVMRILRIFKLVRHFAGLQSLIYTLKQAYKELGLLIILVAIAVLTFSSLVFFAEKDSKERQWTFLDSFWWGLMTLTTVGYGTQSPASLTGKAIGGICAIVGVFILTLPVPIVVNSFASYYKNRLWRNEVAHKRRIRAQEQTRLVKEILTGSRRPSNFSGGGGSDNEHSDNHGGQGDANGGEIERPASTPPLIRRHDDPPRPPNDDTAVPKKRAGDERRKAFKKLFERKKDDENRRINKTATAAAEILLSPPAQSDLERGGSGGGAVRKNNANSKNFLDVPSGNR